MGQENFELETDLQRLMETVERNVSGKPDELIGLLQEFQKKLGYLPESALLEISRLTGQSPANVFGVATFYAQFRFHPVGKHIIRVCRGTACHVKGSEKMLDDLMEYLQVAPGETTADRLFTLETVACFGSCALAPVVVLDDTVYGSMNRVKAVGLIDEIHMRQSEREGEKQAT